jgi:peptidoglycan biosynthesis protein MviN/MurJ (putative lipid II flippase)
MTVAFMVLLIAIAAGILFWRRKNISREERGFNVAVVAIAIIGSAAITSYFWATTGHSSDAPWWPVGALFGSGIWLALAFILGALVRAVLFRKGSKP